MVHAAVVDGVDGGQVLEHVVVGGERRRRYGRAEKGNSVMPSVKYRVRECESRDHFSLYFSFGFLAKIEPKSFSTFESF